MEAAVDDHFHAGDDLKPLNYGQEYGNVRAEPVSLKWAEHIYAANLGVYGY